MKNNETATWNNKILLIDKPPRLTSAAVLNKLKRELHLTKIGHAGTLDKDATGLLVVCTGKMTKLAQYLIAADKKYYAEILLGMTTDTDDLTGTILSEQSTESLDLKTIAEAVSTFAGTQKQMPPRYSAIKINGKRASDRIRKGEDIDLQERDIEIFSIDLLSVSEDKKIVRVAVHCSKGTYIRSLARDLGEKLGVGAVMQYLQRTASGDFTLDSAADFENLYNGSDYVIEPVRALSQFSKMTVAADAVEKIYNGAPFSRDYVLNIEENEKKTYIILDDKKNLIAIADIDIDKWHIRYNNVFNAM